MNAKFERILDLEAAVKASTLSGAFTLAGTPHWRKGQQATAQESDRRKLSEAINALTPEELAAFGVYRKEALA